MTPDSAPTALGIERPTLAHIVNQDLLSEMHPWILTLLEDSGIQFVPSVPREARRAVAGMHPHCSHNRKLCMHHQVWQSSENNTTLLKECIAVRAKSTVLDRQHQKKSVPLAFPHSYKTIG